MLATLHCPASAPTELFLRAVLASGMQQLSADLDYYVPWNRHLLTCLQYVLKVTCLVLLVRAHTVTFNPHFSYFLSPDSSDSVLGSSMGWPADSALLLLDSFMPLQREAIT